MKIDHEYFLMRRNLTIESIIRQNNITSYKAYCLLMSNLRVRAPSSEIFDLAFSIVNPIGVNDENKEEELRGKKNGTGKAPARNASVKKNTDSTSQKKSNSKASAGGTRNIRKKKPAK